MRRSVAYAHLWMDDLEKPLMTARDTTYPSGRLGVGTFDDRAEFGRVVIEAAPPQSPPED